MLLGIATSIATLATVRNSGSGSPDGPSEDGAFEAMLRADASSTAQPVAQQTGSVRATEDKGQPAANDDLTVPMAANDIDGGIAAEPIPPDAIPLPASDASTSGDVSDAGETAVGEDLPEMPVPDELANIDANIDIDTGTGQLSLPNANAAAEDSPAIADMPPPAATAQTDLASVDPNVETAEDAGMLVAEEDADVPARDVSTDEDPPPAIDTTQPDQADVVQTAAIALESTSNGKTAKPTKPAEQPAQTDTDGVTAATIDAADSIGVGGTDDDATEDTDTSEAADMTDDVKSAPTRNDGQGEDIDETLIMMFQATSWRGGNNAASTQTQTSGNAKPVAANTNAAPSDPASAAGAPADEDSSDFVDTNKTGQSTGDVKGQSASLSSQSLQGLHGTQSSQTTQSQPAQAAQTTAPPVALPVQQTAALTSDVAAKLQISASNDTDRTPVSLENLGLTIAAKSADGKRLFEIRLDPPELGRVEVKMTMDDNGKTHVVLTVDKPQTLHMLQRDASDLTRSLADAGIDMSEGDLSFSLRDGREQQDTGGYERGKALSVTAEIAANDIDNDNDTLMLAADGVRLDIKV